MHKRIFTWLGKEFIELTGEAKPEANAAGETRDLFQRYEQVAWFVARQHSAQPALGTRPP